MLIVRRKYLTIDWGYPYQYRRFRLRHNRWAHSVYLQVLRLEVAVWYR